MIIGIQKKFRPRLVAQGTVVLGSAFLMKLFYSTSNVNDLRWILAPTSFLVEVVTDEEFYFESYAGYMNYDRSFLIADSCSGVNFLIMAFLVLCLMKLRKGLSTEVNWGFIPVALGAAFISTLIANTVRIAVAMRIHRMSSEMVWINPEQLHRLEGIFIYFGFLMLLFTLAESLEDVGSYRAVRGDLLRRSLVPLSIYWFITLGIPILNGAVSNGENFREHALFVFIIPMILILPAVAIRSLVRRQGGYASRAGHRAFFT
ncbi:MAG TPA: exosortase K [Pyrinomonadaceae bacterium]|nr:exosortase K [Pyrinomonadaceae bacterium]